MPPLSQTQSMNGAWIEVFKVGTHTDSAGNVANWTPEKIDSYLARYNPVYHEAPVRIDHVEPGQSKNGGPAFGWVEAVKREGSTVYAKLKQVSKQFEEWVRQGLAKKRSIAFDERYGIHHLAFLGYNCPAVPGMENVYGAPAETVGGALLFEFSEPLQVASFGSSARIVGAREAIDILDRKTEEIITAGRYEGRSVAYAEALDMACKQTNYCVVPGTGRRLFSFSCDEFSAFPGRHGNAKIVRGEEAANILGEKTKEIISIVESKGGKICYEEALYMACKQLNYCEVPATRRQLFSISMG